MDSLIDEVRETVRRRRAAGEYPPGLEAELDAHFRSQVPQRFDFTALEEQLSALDRAADVGRHRISTDSESTLGTAVHRAVGRLVTRQTDAILAQLHALAVAVRDVLHTVAERLPDEDVRGMSARLDLVLDRIAGYERAPVDDATAVRDTWARLAALEAAVRSLSTPPWLQDEAAGTGLTPPDDAALAALRQRFVVGTVVEVDVAAGDGAGTVESCADDSLDAVLLLHGVERLPVHGLAAVVAAATHKLRRGGRLVLRASERPSVSGGAWVPGVPLAVVRTLVERAGFGSVDVVHEGAPPESDTGALPAQVRAALEAVLPYIVVALR